MLMNPQSSPQQILETCFKQPAFRPGQEQVIGALLSGRNALAVFPTGGGKSLCYQLPALMLDGLTVVVSPLIALMKDQVDALAALGIKAARMDSSLSHEDIQSMWAEIKSGHCKILYVSPERLQNERFVQRLSQFHIALLAVDEAHCISEWGHNFRPDYLKLAQIANVLKVQRVLALTATATPSVSQDICRQFQIQPQDHVQTGFARPNLAIHITPCAVAEKKQTLLRAIQNLAPASSTVVYVTLQQTAMEVAEYLTQAGISAVYYHAGIKAEERDAIQNQFMQNQVQVVVATIAFGMGIDKSDIRAVFHYNLPKSIENYVQEIGRAGRDGLGSHCEMLASTDDRMVLANFSYGDTPDHASLSALVEFIFDQPESFDVSKYALSNTLDMRQLVLNTALTYLELQNVIKATTPFYDTQKVQFKTPMAEILTLFDAPRAEFLQKVFDAGKQGRTFLSIDLTATAASLGEERSRISKALNYLEEKDMIELQVAGIRQGYRLLNKPDQQGLLAGLISQFEKREQMDIQRLDQVLALANNPQCISNQLTEYFGETHNSPCGCCSHCLGISSHLPPYQAPPLSEGDVQTIRSVKQEGYEALSTPRQLARFLSGMSSPATSRSVNKQRLTGHPSFGALSHGDFQRILAECAKIGDHS